MSDGYLPPIRSEASEWRRQQKLHTKAERDAIREQRWQACRAYWLKKEEKRRERR